VTLPRLRRSKAGVPVPLAAPAFETAVDTDSEAPPAGRLLDTAARLLPGAVGIFGLTQAPELGIGSLSAPRPGLWPLILSILLVLASVVLVVAGDRIKRGEAFQRGSLQVLAGAGTLALFALLIEQIGFELPALVLLLFWLRGLGRETWRASVLISLGTVAAFYLVFIVGLGTSVPHLLSF
jgi:putative tricarboxylic transport membrane protein